VGHRPFWALETPAGQGLIVTREDNTWVVSCERGEPVRRHVLDVALIERQSRIATSAGAVVEDL
jgi:hypothetical protein